MVINSMPSDKATGTDGISIAILKIAAPAISESISRLINHCIDHSTFPTAWRTARVKPIYKGQASKDNVESYRPMSVLPILSKMFEKHVHDGLCNHLKENGLLYKLRSGFRKAH